MTHALEDRLTELEIKATYTEDLLEKLDSIIIRQQDQLDLLTREVLRLRQQAPENSPIAPGQLRDELPPHY